MSNLTILEAIKQASIHDKAYVDQVAAELGRRITELAEAGIDDETINQIIQDYLVAHPIVDTNTTYTLSLDGDYLVLTPSTGSPQRVQIPRGDSAPTATDASQISYGEGTVASALTELSEEKDALNDKVAVSATVSDGVATFKNAKGQNLFTMSIPTGGGTVSGMTETQVRALINTYNFATKSELPASWTETQIRNLITGYGYGTYSKPSGGIPETDLAQAVREKLNNVQGSSGSFTSVQANLLRDALYCMEFSSVEAASQGKVKIDAFIVSIGGTPIESPDAPEQPVVTLSSITASYSGGSVVEGTATSGLAIVVTGNYSDGSSNRVYGFSVSPATISTGSNTLTITYQGKTATVSVTGTAKPAEAPTLQSITATYSGGDVEEGTDATALTGIVVTGHYSDGSTKTETGWTISGAVGVGQNTFTISYSGKTTTITVTGTAKPSEPEEGTEKVVTVEFNKNYYYSTNNGYTEGDVSENYACTPIDCAGYDVLKIEAVDNGNRVNYRVPTPWFGTDASVWHKGTIMNSDGATVTSMTFSSAGQYVTIPLNGGILVGLHSTKSITMTGNNAIKYTLIKEG